MISIEEREEIVNAAVERALLLLPQVMSEIMQEKIALRRLAEQFFTDNPDFQKNKDLVGKTIEDVEGKHPGKSYSDILALARPLIKDRLNAIDSSDFTSTIKPPNQHYNGVL